MLQKALTDKFTELLKVHREASGLSQTDISEMLRIGLRSYQRYESGESSPSLEVTYLLSRILKFELKELFDFNNSHQIIPGFKILNDEESQSFLRDKNIVESGFDKFLESKEYQSIVNRGDIKDIKKSQFFNTSALSLSLSNPRHTILNHQAVKTAKFHSDTVPTTLGQDKPDLMGLIWANFLERESCFFEQITYPDFPIGKCMMSVKGIYRQSPGNHIVLAVLDIKKI